MKQWRIEPGHGYFNIIDLNRPIRLCQVSRSDDANLIAASPELLEALKQLLVYAEGRAARSGEPVIMAARVAIAKAEGK